LVPTPLHELHVVSQGWHDVDPLCIYPIVGQVARQYPPVELVSSRVVPGHERQEKAVGPLQVLQLESQAEQLLFHVFLY
jgi:hypothetical protein